MIVRNYDVNFYPFYCAKGSMVTEMKEYLKLIPGIRTALADGVLVPDSPQHMATEEFYRAEAGDKIHLTEEGFLFAVAIFSLEKNPAYIYSYAYQPEENWATYTGNLTPQDYKEEDYIFEGACYFRVCVKRKDGEDMTQEDFEVSEKLLEFSHEQTEYITKPCFEQEIKETINSIRQEENSNTMKVCMLTDTHFTINGTWEDTARNIQSVAEKVNYDAIVHLGDFTDGMLSKQMTSRYVGWMINDLQKCGAPLYIVPGNHDWNYFRNQPNTFTTEEMKQVYQLHGDYDYPSREVIAEELDYYIDLPAYCVRMIFLSSFDDTAPIRYGYKDSQLTWLKKVLNDSEEGMRILVFSHDAPLAKLDYWSYYIRNGEKLLDILEEYNAQDAHQVIGFFYGHTHADYIFEECSFPVVSIGCAKLEYFTDKKPEGAIAWSREEGKVTQDLWDSLLVDFERKKLKLIRFGAGNDREVSFEKKPSTYKMNLLQQRLKRTTKIWAHRGASGRAPENTLPAFELAYRLGADGIELDVQLSKDGVPVVIHDEQIDRVSDGTGRVMDYTLKELQQFNFNKQFPAYGKVMIPTLEEVYELIKSTDMVINLELKNSVVLYEGLEEKVLKLAEEMNMADRIIYSSFNHYSMKKVKQLNPAARIAFLYSNGILDIAEYADKYHAYAVHPSRQNMEYHDIVKECHDKNIRVHVWTVNEQNDFEKMRKLGVDAVITNYVERG